MCTRALQCRCPTAHLSAAYLPKVEYICSKQVADSHHLLCKTSQGEHIGMTPLIIHLLLIAIKHRSGCRILLRWCKAGRAHRLTSLDSSLMGGSCRRTGHLANMAFKRDAL